MKVYVNTEGRALKARKSYEELASEVEQLRKAVERLEKKIQQLEADRK
jgi:ubiquinone biosynthesis protein UbiJ